jgi:hypothetical protein
MGSSTLACHNRSRPRAVPPPPQYQSMEPSLPRSPGPPLPPFGVPYNPRTQVYLGQLVGSPESITLFMVPGLSRNPATEEETGSPVVEPLTRGTANLSISDRPATTHPRVDPPLPTPNTTNPNPNESGSDSPPRFSPLDNWVIRRVIRAAQRSGEGGGGVGRT